MSSFSPIVPHNGGDDLDKNKQQPCDMSQNAPDQRSRVDNLLMDDTSAISAPPESEIVQRAMTPVIGSLDECDEAILHTTSAGCGGGRLSHIGGNSSRLDENNLLYSATSNTPQCQTPLHR